MEEEFVEIERENELMEMICFDRNRIFSTRNSFLPLEFKWEYESSKLNSNSNQLQNKLIQLKQDYLDHSNQFNLLNHIHLKRKEEEYESNSFEMNLEQIEKQVIEFEKTFKRFNQVYISDIKPWTQHSIPPTEQSQFNNTIKSFSEMIRIYKEMIDSFHLLQKSFFSSSGISFEKMNESDNDQQLNENAIYKLKSGIEVLEESIKRRKNEGIKPPKTFFYSGQVFE